MPTNNYIKHQGPRKNSKYHQGLIKQECLKKYYVEMNQLFIEAD